jgi:hypothetical protein
MSVHNKLFTKELFASGDVAIAGTLTVTGETTLIQTTNTFINDNLIVINNGEAGSGVGAGSGTAGIEINRGLLTNTKFLFNESDDKWVVGSGDTTGTDRFIVAELADASPGVGQIPGFNSDGRLQMAAGLSGTIPDQLRNIGTKVISADQWDYLSTADQYLKETSNVIFNDVTVSGALTLTNPVLVGTSVSGVITANLTVDKGISRFDTTTLGAITATLPSNAIYSGKTLLLYLQNAITGSPLNIVPASGDSIEGVAVSMELTEVGQHLRITSVGDGTWLIN